MQFQRMAAGLAFAAAMVASAWARSPEYRVMWVSRFEWPSASEVTAKANIDSIMQNLAANGFNAVLFQVRGQCDVHYPSPYEPWAATYGWTDPGWDPLAYAIQAAHSRGLEFHAYINTHTLAQDTPPANTVPQHQYNLHGPNVDLAQSWVIRDQSGATATSDNYTWISPGIPEASWWVRRAVMHVVENYDVDGVHFDRIRTPGAQYSYDPVTVARFNGDGNPDGLAWGDFMRSQITRDLRNIYGEIQWKKKRVKVSAAPFGIVLKDATTHYQGTGTQSYKEWYQDSWGWMNAHVVDFMVPQIYWEVGSSHPFELLLADWQEHRGGRFVVAGSTANGGSKTASALLAEYQQTVSQNAAGHCIFSVSSMANYWTTFSSGPYATPAAIPDMPWKSAPATGNIVGFVRDMAGLPVLDAKVNRTGDPYNYLSAYDGFFSILEVPTSVPLTLTASKAGKGKITVDGIMVGAGETTVVTLTLSQREGVVTLDKSQYQFDEEMNIRLTDEDLAGTVHASVLAQSTAEPAGETVVLDEATTPGIFTGSIRLAGAGAAKPDGVLRVDAGDTVTVVYQDADRGDGTPATATATAAIITPPDIIIESRTASGAVTAAPAYQEFLTTGGAWANTTSKSQAPGLVAPGSRFTSNGSLGAYAVWRPTIITPGLYDVYITLANATRGPNNYSPGAGFAVQHLNGTTTGTFDLTRDNAALIDQWMLLAGNVRLGKGTAGSLTIVNNNPSSAGNQRFCMDGVKFVFKGWGSMTAGSVSFDRPKYGVPAVAQVRLIDSDLAGAGHADVNVASGAEPTGETVTLAEMGSTGEFEGTIAVQAGSAASGDGVLQVLPSDKIVLRYDDVDDGAGTPATATATAIVDGVAPTISAVEVTDVMATRATVRFATDEPSTAVVRYGHDPNNLDQTATVDTPAQALSAALLPLAPAATYYFVIEAADDVGNLARADNGGACYSFQTPGVPAGLSESFDVQPDGWTKSGLWRLVGEDDSCLTPASPPHCYHYGREDTCNYDTGAANSGSLVSPQFVVPPLGELTFLSWEDTEGFSFFDTRRILVVSDGGATRTALAQLEGGGGEWYQAGPFSLAAYAGQVVQIEFAFDTVDDFMNAYAGWAVDDVLVESADKLRVSDGAFAASGNVGGPFQPASADFTLWNKGTAPLDWASTQSVSWVTLTPASGTLAGGETTTVTVALNAEAPALPEGVHTGEVAFFNVATGLMNTRTVAVTVANPPAAPSDLHAVAVTQTEVSLAWTDNASNETAIVVERDSGSGFAPVATLPADTVAWVDSGLNADTPYAYRVYAANGWGASAPSNVLEVRTLPWTPAAPSDLTATLSGGAVDLAWRDNAANETGYEIEWAAGAGAFQALATLPADATSYHHATPLGGARNRYRVRAVNAAHPSAWSNEAAVLVPLADSFASPPVGWTVQGASSAAAKADYDAEHGALRLWVARSSQQRVLGWQSPRLALTGDPDTIYRFKAYVFRAGQANMRDSRHVPNMRLRCSVRFAMNSMLETFWHLAADPASNGDMLANLPSADPANPTAYRVDLDPVDVPLLDPARMPDEGVQGMFEVYSVESQENGALELAEAALMALPAPTDVRQLKVLATGATNAGDLRHETWSRSTRRGTRPLPSLDDLTTYGLVIDTTACRADDLAIASVEIQGSSDLRQRVRVEPGRAYRVRWHVVSPREAALQAQLRLRLRTLRFAWSQKFELGGAWAAGAVNNALAQQVLPGVGTANPAKRGDELPGVLDGGWYTMYFNGPNVVPLSQPGPGVKKSSRRDLRCGVDVIDTMSGGSGAALEGGLFIVDRIEIADFPILPD
jgi:uncharacterized lipoprotein YddW (UPF0748 family)